MKASDLFAEMPSIDLETMYLFKRAVDRQKQGVTEIGPDLWLLSDFEIPPFPQRFFDDPIRGLSPGEIIFGSDLSDTAPDTDDAPDEPFDYE